MSRRPFRWIFEDALASTTRALEALSDGDAVHAEQILGALAHELETAIIGAPGVRCGNCGLRFDWPGQLDKHMRVAHYGEPWKAPLKRSRAA